MSQLLSLFLAVCQIENPRHVKGQHADGLSWGVAGVTAGCLVDYNKAHKDDPLMLPDMDDPQLAQRVFDWYTRNGKTIDDKLVIWHCGAGRLGKSRSVETQDYIERVKNLMED